MESKEREALNNELLARKAGQPTPEALKYAIAAADLYMGAQATAANQAARTRLRQKCFEMINFAEKLKSREQEPDAVPIAVRQITTQEKTILLRSSRLHGNVFLPWERDPSDESFALSPGGANYTDTAPFSMSSEQSDILDGWRRPAESPTGSMDDHSRLLMTPIGACDLVQDVTTDCSVVASLCAAMKLFVTHTSNKPLLSLFMYPYDHEKKRPKVSPNGKYMFRMHFNGCFRQVVVDDRLPMSRPGVDRSLFVVDRRNPDLLWPALMEKAYLKVRGGYDFPGSNSGTDLWVLTGWVPEQLFLQSEDVDLNHTWGRLAKGYRSNNVIITLGTGRLAPSEEDALGLAGEHDYAVLDLNETEGIRRLLVKNPWCNGLVWNGSTPRGTLKKTLGSPPPEQNATEVGEDEDEDEASLLSGTFWISLDEVAQHFESMYFNWDPSCFKQRQDHHFTWQVPQGSLSSTLAYNPQYSMRSATGEVVWVLLSRHFADDELKIARDERSASLAAAARRLGYTGISIFENDGKKVQASETASYRGPFVDSPQTLAKFELAKGRTYTVVMTHEDLPLSSYSCTFSFFSQSPLEVKPARDELQFYQQLSSSWSRRSAGGNASFPTYSQNPQFSITVPHATPLSILLSTGDRDVAIHADLVWSAGRRVTSIGRKDVVASSGDYRCGTAYVCVPEVEAGTYVIVCSTFEPGQLADFTLRIGSATECAVRPVPGDAAGLLCSRVPALAFASGEEKKRVRVSAPRLVRAYVQARCPRRQQAGENGHLPRAAIRLSLVYGRGPSAEVLVSSGSGEFQELAASIRTPEFDIEPDRQRQHDLFLVVEQLGSHRPRDGIEVEFFGDSMIHCGEWEVVDD